MRGEIQQDQCFINVCRVIPTAKPEQNINHNCKERERDFPGADERGGGAMTVRKPRKAKGRRCLHPFDFHGNGMPWKTKPAQWSVRVFASINKHSRDLQGDSSF